jgi:reverse transcriptase-like protein
MLGDWHRDPWAWPELNWVANNRPEFLYERLSTDGVRSPALLDVVKENFVLRPAVVLDPLDRLSYQALVDRESVKLIGTLSPMSYGWRLDRSKPAAGDYASQAKEWDEYRARLVQLATKYPAGLQTDIVSYFASINIRELADNVHSRLGNNAVARRLEAMLAAWNKVADRGGLPQRALPSAVLSNLYLMPLDDVLLQYATVDDSGPSVVRWVDDIWIFGSDIGQLRHVQVQIQHRLASLALNLNAGKTALLEGENLISAARESEHSAVDAALEREPPDAEPLDRLVDRILERPELTARTTIRFATKRMRDTGRYHRVPDLMSMAHRMPQGADSLARLVRDADLWREYIDWFVAYAASPWVPCDWAVAQFGTMFPADTNPNHRGLLQTFFRAVGPTSAISLLALAAHRLAAWTPAIARGALRNAASRVSAGWQRRILAFAGLSAGLDISWVRNLLGDLDENRVSLALLEETHFKAPRTAADYE